MLQVLRLLGVPPSELRGLGLQVTRLDNAPQGAQPAPGRLRQLMAPAPPATAFDAANLPRWYHDRPGVTKALADHAHSAAAAAASAATAAAAAAALSAAPAGDGRWRGCLAHLLRHLHPRHSLGILAVWYKR
jgi:hypothetical protein